MHEPSSLPGKPTDETPAKGRNRSWQPSSLEVPSAVPAERHLKGRLATGGPARYRRAGSLPAGRLAEAEARAGRLTLRLIQAYGQIAWRLATGGPG